MADKRIVAIGTLVTGLCVIAVVGHMGQGIETTGRASGIAEVVGRGAPLPRLQTRPLSVLVVWAESEISNAGNERTIAAGLGQRICVTGDGVNKILLSLRSGASIIPSGTTWQWPENRLIAAHADDDENGHTFEIAWPPPGAHTLQAGNDRTCALVFTPPMATTAESEPEALLRQENLRLSVRSVTGGGHAVSEVWTDIRIEPTDEARQEETAGNRSRYFTARHRHGRVGFGAEGHTLWGQAHAESDSMMRSLNAGDRIQRLLPEEITYLAYKADLESGNFKTKDAMPQGSVLIGPGGQEVLRVAGPEAGAIAQLSVAFEFKGSPAGLQVNLARAGQSGRIDVARVDAADFAQHERGQPVSQFLADLTKDFFGANGDWSLTLTNNGLTAVETDQIQIRYVYADGITKP